jgi:hypothetical protein
LRRSTTAAALDFGGVGSRRSRIDNGRIDFGGVAASGARTALTDVHFDFGGLDGDALSPAALAALELGPRAIARRLISAESDRAARLDDSGLRLGGSRCFDSTGAAGSFDSGVVSRDARLDDGSLGLISAESTAMPPHLRRWQRSS